MQTIHSITFIHKVLVFLLPGMISISLVYAQADLESILASARSQDPSLQLMQLIQMEKSQENKIANKNYLPQLSINAQASYQSEVTNIDIPFPGIEIEPLDKDQYRIVGELNQLVYDGGMISASKTIMQIQKDLESNQSELNWKKVERQIIELYFALLEIKSQIKILGNAAEILDKNRETLSEAIDNGLRLSSELAELDVKRIELEQANIQLNYKLENVLNSIALLSGLEYDENTQFKIPSFPKLNPETSSIPLKNLQLSNSIIHQQFQLYKTSLKPKLVVFGQLGYGKPGYNFLKNEFDDFYMVGARIKWNLSAFYVYQNQKEKMSLNTAKIQQKIRAHEIQKSIRNENFNMQISSLQEIISTDQQILNLYTEILNTAESQLNSGIISVNEYLTKFNAQKNANEFLEKRRLQLLKTQYLKAHEINF